jgi:heptosyltransferase-2
MHIGAALSIPQIAIFGSSNPEHTPPLSQKAQVIWLGLDCSPCYQRTCPLGHLNCLNQIEAERVYSMLTPLKT